jgi:hypothetical protein
MAPQDTPMEPRPTPRWPRGTCFAWELLRGCRKGPMLDCTGPLLCPPPRAVLFYTLFELFLCGRRNSQLPCEAREEWPG